MTIKVIKKRDRIQFEEECEKAILNGYKLLNFCYTPDFCHAGIFENGGIELQAKSAKLDKELVKENTDLNKEISELKKAMDVKEKELGLIQANFSDMQDQYAAAIADGEKIQEQNDQLEEVNNKAGSEIEAFKKELTTCKGQNTKLKKKIEALIDAEE